jgi:two-component sensor histidine kinase
VRLTRADNVKTYVDAVEGRINALARVHTILSLSSWQGAELNKLIEEELAPYSLGGQIRLSGPEVQLLPATAQTLALALHELFTNSAKYGALSTRSGKLAIGWRVEDETLALSWDESGGPQVRPPMARGFGTKSLMASVESQLGGQAHFDWRPEGLLCRLDVPLKRKATASPTVEKLEIPTGNKLQRVSV